MHTYMHINACTHAHHKNTLSTHHYPPPNCMDVSWLHPFDLNISKPFSTYIGILDLEEVSHDTQDLVDLVMVSQLRPALLLLWVVLCGQGHERQPVRVFQQSMGGGVTSPGFWTNLDRKINRPIIIIIMIKEFVWCGNLIETIQSALTRRHSLSTQTIHANKSRTDVDKRKEERGLTDELVHRECCQREHRDSSPSQTEK